MKEGLETVLDSDDFLVRFKEHLTALETHLLSIAGPCSVTSEIKLFAVLGKVRGRELLKLTKYLCEIDEEGLRRCVFKRDGVRCKAYGSLPVCDKHYEKATMISPTIFKNSSLRQAYMRNLANPRKLQADSELAVLRTMMELLISKTSESGNLPMEQIAAISTLAEKITTVVDKMHKMNEITPEKIELLMEKVVDIISEYVHPDKLKECASKITEVGASLPSCTVPYLPGDSIELRNSEGVFEDEKVTTVHQRSLIEAAVMLGIDDAGN